MTGVRLSDGTTVPADLVVVGIGVAPCTGWLEGSGLDRGIVTTPPCARRTASTSPGTSCPSPTPCSTASRCACSTGCVGQAGEQIYDIARNAVLAAGWLPLFFSPTADGFYRDALAEGFARPGSRRTPEDFEVAASVPMVVHDDVEKAADRVRPQLALYIGGGARGANFHLDVFARMGWEQVCARVQEHYLAGRRREAVAAIPTGLVTDVALVGPPGRIREEVARWSGTVVTSLLVQSVPFAGDDVAGLRAIADALH